MYFSAPMISTYFLSAMVLNLWDDVKEDLLEGLKLVVEHMLSLFYRHRKEAAVMNRHKIEIPDKFIAL